MSEKTPVVPEKWKRLPLADMIENGWHPKRKTVKGTEYLVLRSPKNLGNTERGLGPFTEENWNLLMEMFPRLKVSDGTEPHDESTMEEGPAVFPVKTGKPKSVSKSLDLSLETLRWYEWTQSKGYNKDLGDFLNEIVHTFFQDQGFVMPVVIVRGESA